MAITGVLVGGVYGLIALGLPLIFGVMRVINFAHGEMMVWGMYVAYTILLWTGVDPFFSFLVSAVILFFIGYILQWTIVNRILDLPEAMQVFLMVGMAMVFEICCRRDEFTYSQQRDSGLTQQVALERLGKPEEIVKITLFLSFEESSDINGTTSVMDGGMTGCHPVGFLDLIAEMMKKKGS